MFVILTHFVFVTRDSLLEQTFFVKATNLFLQCRFRSLSRVKQCDMKCKRRRAKKRHRQSEEAARKLWVEQQKYFHAFGKEAP